MLNDEGALQRAAAASHGGSTATTWTAAQPSTTTIAGSRLRLHGGVLAAHRVADLLLRHGPPRFRVLDAGWRHGAARRRAFGARPTDLTCVDVSDRSLDVARARGVYRELLRADLQAPLPFADGTIEAAGCAGC